MDDAATRAPILTRQAKYEWGEWTVEVNEGSAARLTITHHKSFNQRDDRSQRTTLEMDIEDVPDVLRLVQHALDSRQSP